MVVWRFRGPVYYRWVPSAPKCTANNAGWNDKAVQEIVRIPILLSYIIGLTPLMNMVSTMLEKALTTLNPGERPVLHSDQGWQYQMKCWQAQLKVHGLTQSMSRRENCLDNAVAESFFGTLKSECFYLKKFGSIRDASSGGGQVHPLLQP